MLVEFTVPMEGPRSDLHPKGLSRRPGSQEDVPDAEGLVMIERGLAFAIDADGYPIKISTGEHQVRQAAAGALAAAETEAAANRQAPVERTTQRPAKPVERAVTQPTPAKPGAPRGASGGKAAKVTA